jgi:hypothetical protein
MIRFQPEYSPENEASFEELVKRTYSSLIPKFSGEETEIKLHSKAGSYRYNLLLAPTFNSIIVQKNGSPLQLSISEDGGVRILGGESPVVSEKIKALITPILEELLELSKD